MASFGAVDLALILVALIWGANASIVKLSLAGWDPLAWNFLRFVLGSAIMGAVLLWRERDWRLRRELVGPLLLLGLIGTGLYQVLFIKGIALTTASNTALILGSAPIVVTLWSALAGYEQVTWSLWAGALASVAGLAMVVLGKPGGLAAGRSTLPGDLLVIGCMLAWATYTVYVRQVQKKAPSALYVTGWGMLLGAVVLGAASLPSILAQDVRSAPAGSWLGMVYSASMAIVLAYVLYGWGVQRIGSARASLYTNLVPVIAAAVAWLTLDEQWTLLQWAGALLVVGGVTGSRLGAAPARPRPEAGLER